ncbi:hypothetical protein [Micromonospora sp. WMMD736]|uniref:hypothetical protein n=1 Tax=Micromonospora sp. WMMD736 TaxID=3404112 RepID=UPI003B93423F
MVIAAIAEHYGVAVLHYDHDFDRISAVTDQIVDWVGVRAGADEDTFDRRK